MPRGSRIAIWCIALLLSLSLFIKGRVPTGKGEDATFFRTRPGNVTVRLAGDFPNPGLYLLPDGAKAIGAIKMTLPGAPLPVAVAGDAGGRLVSGDVVILRLRGGQPPVFSMGRMGAKELMLLGIPLVPDLMGLEDWCNLPGIGPVLSKRIVFDRHKNGAFGVLDGLLRVPGIGPGKLDAIRRYF